MKKLELKHIAPYLPYGLKFKAEGKVWEMTDLSTIDQYAIWAGSAWCKKSLTSTPAINATSSALGRGFVIKDIKPILRPLSDLTKEIEHNGEMFIPCEQFSYDMECMLRLGDVDTGCQPYSLIQKLIEWHFDIFGLIDKDLAIDINNL